MIKLKKRIKVIESLPKEKKKQLSIISILSILLICFLIGFLAYYLYSRFLPTLNSINIKNISGKKVNITKCNTKDYIIIEKDKTYAMSITNEMCEVKYYEGQLKIYNNEIIFNKNIKGIISSDYNIIVNGALFEKEDINE